MWLSIFLPTFLFAFLRFLSYHLPNTDGKPIKSSTLTTRRYLRRDLCHVSHNIFLRHWLHGNSVVPEREWDPNIGEGFVVAGCGLWAVNTYMVQWACGWGPVLFVFLGLIGLGSENVQFNHNILRRIIIFINHFFPTFSFLGEFHELYTYIYIYI